MKLTQSIMVSMEHCQYFMKVLLPVFSLLCCSFFVDLRGSAKAEEVMKADAPLRSSPEREEDHRTTVTDVQLQPTDLDSHLQPAATRLFLKVGSLCG